MHLSALIPATLALLSAIPPTHAATATSSSLHYRLRARVTGPQNATTPAVSGWALEVQRLGVPTRLPPDYMWGVLINATFAPSRGGDVFYAQRTGNGTSSSSSHIRTDAPNNSGEVLPFGITALGRSASQDYPMDGVEMSAVRYIDVPPEETTDVAVGAGGVPFVHKRAGGGENGTFAACTGLYSEWATLYWIDVAKYGTGPIYSTGADYQDCTPVELVPECVAGGPSYEGLEERPCVADVTTVL
ncbi:uncharacterized protein BKCO1_2700092 [Diplodia corticola]|uniref:Cell wall protein n=1 Tax=Diplodia corticola TaxID=236234 RepID=A0A1J9RMR9_9PEZI|nr:uncharacterized protein BKCO1_2700092 [Diplodia corticola]OJD33867.1 hypothetical protein BKCO1_2700092 [Diplodia corticola]